MGETYETQGELSRNANIGRRVVIVAMILVVLLVILALRCQVDPIKFRELDGQALLVPDQVPIKFNVFEPDEIVQFCLSYTKPADYSGIARGAYGTLWAGGGNPVDRLLLIGEVLSSRGYEVRIRPQPTPCLWYKDQTWKSVEISVDGRAEYDIPLDPDAIDLNRVAVASDDQVHKVEFAFELFGKQGDRDGTANLGASQRLEPGRAQKISSPITLAECTYQPVVINVVRQSAENSSNELDELNSTSYELRIGDSVLLDSGALSGVTRVRLRIDWKFEGTTQSYFRELFDLANGAPNIPGHAYPNESDRYVVSIGSGPLSAEVLETRKSMMHLERYTRVSDPWERSLLLLATRFMQEVDKVTLGLSERFSVQCTGLEPRIVVASAEVVNRKAVKSGDESERLAMSIDVINDQVDAAGPNARYFQAGRSLALDEIETRVLFDATKSPVVSATSVLSQFKSCEATTIQRRIKTIRNEIERIFRREANGSRLALQASSLLNDRESNVCPRLVLERVQNGICVHGLGKVVNANDGETAWQPDGSIVFKNEPVEIAAIVEAHFRQQMQTSLFRIQGELKSSWNPQGLDVVDGSCLTYRVSGPNRKWNQVVFVSMESGAPSGIWFDLDTDQSSITPLKGSWPNVLSTGSGQADEPMSIVLDGILGPVDAAERGVAEVFQLQVGGETRLVNARRMKIKRDEGDEFEVVLLPAGKQSLILEIKSGTNTVSLASTTPVVNGFVLDAETKRPISMATIDDQGGAGAVQSSMDGSFQISLSEPLKPRLILVLDVSKSMRFGIESTSEHEAPAGEQRIDYVRRAVAKLLDGLPANVEIALWSFNTPKRYYGKFMEAGLVKTQQDFTADRQLILEKLNAVKPNGGTPLTAVVSRLEEFLVSDPLSRGATVIVLADGANSCKTLSADDAYEEIQFRVPIHTIGFAVDADGAAVEHLQKLSNTSGGTHQRVGTEKELVGAFKRFERDFENVGLSVKAGYYRSTNIFATVRSPGTEPLKVLMEPGGKSAELLHISKSNSDDVRQCKGLSPKAMVMVQEKVESGNWEVLIPNQRTNIGNISAYAWVEIEPETGRCVGRTEDGLHGSLAVDGEWPKISGAATLRGAPPIVAYVKGVASHAAASTVVAMRWHHQPNFLEADSVDFMNYVILNALVNVFEWHKEVGLVLKIPIGPGSGAPSIGPVGQIATATLKAEEAFWAGVGTSMEMQRIAALRLKRSEDDPGDP